MTRPTQSGGPFHFPYQRIIVTGANGAGKTWFARRLSAASMIPWINNDALALGVGWAYREKSVIVAAQKDAITAPMWIVEGGPSLIRPEIAEHADLVIWLDLPRGVRVARIIWRSLTFTGRTRPEHPEGNVEWPGMRQWAFIVKAWRNDAAVRDQLDSAIARRSGPHIRLCSARDVADFLRRVQFAGEGAEPF